MDKKSRKKENLKPATEAYGMSELKVEESNAINLYQKRKNKVDTGMKKKTTNKQRPLSPKSKTQRIKLSSIRSDVPARNSSETETGLNRKRNTPFPWDRN